MREFLGRKGFTFSKLNSGIDGRIEVSASVHSSRRGDVTSARNNVAVFEVIMGRRVEILRLSISVLSVRRARITPIIRGVLASL